jgi:UDP:flavonoid glycosyltransferase YjiC (YdhE family)
MRAVFMPFSGISHALVMVPLAWAMRAAGHDAIFLAGGDAVAVRDAGLPVINPIPGGDLGFVRALPEAYQPVPDLTIAQMVELRKKIVGLWDNLVDDYVAAAKQLAPDLIVYDPVFNAGLIAAAALDVPAVGHGLGIFRHTPEFLREHAAPAFERHQVELPKKIMMIELVPDSLMLEDGTSMRQMRYIPYNGTGIVPSWVFEMPTRPRIAVTLGRASVITARANPLVRTVEAAREVDAEFVLTVDDATAATLGPLPPNVRVTGWVPLRELIRTCSAIIHHGGTATMLTACVAGIPQFAIPEGFGYEFNARSMARYGFGLTGTADDINADAIMTLLSDPGLKSAAQKIRQEIEQLPSPSEMIHQIVEFAR